MRDQILKELIDLRKQAQSFCTRVSESMLAPIAGTTIVVDEFRQRSFDGCSIAELSRVFDISEDEIRDKHIAWMNKNWGQEGERKMERRESQRKVTTAIDQLRRSSTTDNPKIQDTIEIIQLYMHVNLADTLDQGLAACITQEINIWTMMNEFTSMSIGPFRNIFGKNERIAQSLIGELDAIQKKVNAIKDQAERHQEDLRIDLLEVLQRQYELENSAGNYDALMECYRQGNIDRQYGKVRDLQDDCAAITAKIYDLRDRDRSAAVLPSHQGFFCEETRFAVEIRAAERLLQLRKGFLARFCEVISLRTSRLDCATGELNEAYDSDAVYLYAVRLLRDKQPDKAARRLADYLRDPRRRDYHLKAYCLLYIIFTNQPLEKGQETTLQHYLYKALELENAPADPGITDSRPLGIGHYLHVLHHLKCGGTSRMDAVSQHCFAAADKGFDFKSLVEKMMGQHALDMDQVLFDFESVADLRQMNPERSREYARIFLALICQKLNFYDEAQQHLLAIDTGTIVDRSHRSVIETTRTMTQNLYDSATVDALLQGLSRSVREGLVAPKKHIEKIIFKRWPFVVYKK
jgi:hypothetical protein